MKYQEIRIPLVILVFAIIIVIVGGLYNPGGRFWLGGSGQNLDLRGSVITEMFTQDIGEDVELIVKDQYVSEGMESLKVFTSDMRPINWEIKQGGVLQYQSECFYENGDPFVESNRLLRCENSLGDYIEVQDWEHVFGEPRILKVHNDYVSGDFFVGYFYEYIEEKESSYLVKIFIGSTLEDLEEKINSNDYETSKIYSRNNEKIPLGYSKKIEKVYGLNGLETVTSKQGLITENIEFIYGPSGPITSVYKADYNNDGTWDESFSTSFEYESGYPALMHMLETGNKFHYFWDSTGDDWGFLYGVKNDKGNYVDVFRLLEFSEN